jgi:hypothetical protein
MALPFKLLQADHLSVAAGILGVVGLIVCTFDYVVPARLRQLFYENAANRYLVFFDGSLGLFYGFGHEELHGLVI